jgi:hypothetical protein
MVKTPWHVAGKVDTNIKLHFGLDFDRYWFAPMGRLFGVLEEDVTDLAKNVAVHHFQIPRDDTYKPDPRASQWNYDEVRRGTWHDHGSYPRIHDFSFYYSYHSLMSVAAQMHTEMPLVAETDLDSTIDPWEEWLEGHLLCRKDGRWLSDRRDPSPVQRPDWGAAAAQENWLLGLQGSEFIERIWNQSRSPFVVVSGHWTESREYQMETVSVASALVTPKASLALANALRSHDDPLFFKLPSYQESGAESDIEGFKLIGWIANYGNVEDHLDTFDPHARRIDYPPHSVGEAFETRLGLIPDSERRQWQCAKTGKICLTGEVWSENLSDKGDDRSRGGVKLTGSVDFLKKLCAETGMQLIVEVQIKRQFDRTYSQRASNEPYCPANFNIFVFSKDGTLRDTTKSHKLG